MTALETANEIRVKRAQLKRDIKAGKIRVTPLVQDPPEWLLSMKIFDLLLATPKFGRVKVNKMLNRCHISPSKTIGGLTERQRRELLAFI